ncbi:MAG: hypothetical protein QHH19_03010 [Candidatus Thermoplasmatota archaeon]|nr:hypothetical protein [Candidatus Thermoplasmatota archaeon]
MQAIIISTIIIALLWVFAFYPLLDPITTALQNINPPIETFGSDDIFELLFLMQIMFGVVSVMFFLLLTLVFYLAINYLKKRNTSN